MRQKDLSDAIGLELERREKAMTFEEWLRQECFKAPPEHSVELAKSAWDYQQQAIDALSLEWAKQQARIEALEDFNYRRRKAYRDRVIDALHNIDTEESPELEDALNLAHNAIYNAVTKALLEGE